MADRAEERSLTAGPGGACPACDGDGCVQFAWSEPPARHRGHFWAKDLARYRSSLRRERPLRRGWLYRCPVCGQRWYLDADAAYMHILSDAQWDVVSQWHERPLTMPDSLVETLKEIGATPPDIYGNGLDRIEFPCRVVTHAGETHDPAILRLQKLPPLGIFRPERHLVSEITAVDPSPYALSRETRLASTRVNETRMGLSPFAAEAPDGQVFMFNGTSNFFRHPGYEARQLRPCREQGRETIPDAIHVRWVEPTSFIGDWDEALVRLRIEAD